MAKTAAQKAKRKLKRAAAKAAGKKSGRGRASNAQPKRKSKKKRNKVNRRTAKGSRNTAEGRMNVAYRTARYSGMSRVTDGISIMKTVHNNSYIEDTFQVRREKVANVIGSTGPTLVNNQALFINPGNSVLFPIFSQIANTYQQYRINDVVFSYETEAYAASGTAVSAGKVLLATNYNPSQGVFVTDSQMENFSNSDRGAPFCEIVHDVMLGDHSLKNEPLKDYFVNFSANTAAPAGESGKFFDIGLFQLSTQGNVDATSEIGELYVTYSFTMIRPVQSSSIGLPVASAHAVEGANGTATAAAPLGTTGLRLRTGSTLPVTGNTTSFVIPVLGSYLVAVSWFGTTIASVPTFALGANITLGPIVFNDDVSQRITFLNAGGGASGITEILIVSTNGVGAANTVTLGGNAGMVNGAADLFVCPISSAILTAPNPNPRWIPPPSLEEQEYRSRIDRLEAMVVKLLRSNDEKQEIDSDSDAVFVGSRKKLRVVCPLTPILKSK